MGFFSKLFNSLSTEVEKKEDANTKEVLVREMLRRNETFLKEYNFWVKEGMHRNLLKSVYNKFQTRANDNNADVNLYILDKPNAKGFYFRAESPWTVKDYQFLLHHFQNRLIEVDYHVNNSTREAVETNSELIIEEITYLKPRLKFRRELPYNQLFGNVILEHKIVGEHTDLVKIMVNTYTDRNFKTALHFEDFIHQIFLPS